MPVRLPLTILAAIALAPAAPALAHAKVVSSTPAANAVIAAPKAISVTFNEKVVPAFSKLEVSMAGMAMNVPVKTSVSADGKTITAVPQGPFMKGGYVIKWTAAAADDGHHTAGSIPFKIK
jgi:methionine-rich copper-binding protein CopC